MKESRRKKIISEQDLKDSNTTIALWQLFFFFFTLQTLDLSYNFVESTLNADNLNQ